MGNKNKLDLRLENGERRSSYADALEAERRRLADERRGLVRDLTNRTVGFGLARRVAVEGFNGRKTDEGRQREERGKARELSHSTNSALLNRFCQWWTRFAGTFLPDFVAAPNPWPQFSRLQRPLPNGRDTSARDCKRDHPALADASNDYAAKATVQEPFGSSLLRPHSSPVYQPPPPARGPLLG